MFHFATVSQSLLLLPDVKGECKSPLSVCHAEGLTSISLDSATWLQSISTGLFLHDKMSTKWGKDKDEKKKRESYLRDRGEGISITEAPDVTVARESPWRCCGRPKRTSLGVTGGHKGGIRHKEDKKRRVGSLEVTCLGRYIQRKV